MSSELILLDYFKNHPDNVGKLVAFDLAKDKICSLDLTSANAELTDVVNDIKLFSSWITAKLSENGCKYGIGGYNENRLIYSNKNHFNGIGEPRSLHLGVDIWAEAGTIIFCPLDAHVHSFKNNSASGDYGATIILIHELPGLKFYSLYGHLSLNSLRKLKKGRFIPQGDVLATLGLPEENGNWPPHLHFQLIMDMYSYEGDYPGVCRYSEREKWLMNSPDPGTLLDYTFNR